MFNIDIYTGGIAATNGYLLAAPEGSILIDAPEGAGDWLKEKGVQVGALFLTHGHYDHVMDAARIRREHGCAVFAREEITPELTLETLFAGLGLGPAPEAVEVDEVLGDAAGLSALGRKFRVLHIPGHSPDSICFVPEPLDDEEREGPVVFSGDVLFQGSIGRTDFPNGDHNALVNGIRSQLYPLGDEVTVYPGHGPPTTIGEERRTNPFVGE